MDDELAANQRAWDIVAPQFRGVCALPAWGPFGVCKDKDLLGDLGGNTVLEIGCGSGHSLEYLVKRGVRKAYGLDFSTTQLRFSAELNRAAIDAGKVELIQSAMEHAVPVEPLDVIVSIYALGWTRDPRAVFRHLWSYLKPAGRLIWSWGHQLFDKVAYEDGRFILRQSYFDESTRFVSNWNGSGGVYMQQRTIATWFRYQTEAGFVVREFLEPAPSSFAEAPEDPTRYYAAAKAKHVPGTTIFVCEKA